MLTTIMAAVRIFSNSASNVCQKQLTANDYSPSFINFIMYAGIIVLLLPAIIHTNFLLFDKQVWIFAVLGGLFGAFGNYYLVKALENGELSVLGPINAYKSVVAMIIGIILLGEIPSLFGILAVGLIIAGSYIVFDTQEEGFSFRLLKRKDIRYRIYALIFTGIEAVFIKEVIIRSDVMTSLVLWSFFGMIFTGLLVIKNKSARKIKGTFAISKFIMIILLMCIMQYSTNYVFSHMQVSYGLALFQLSALLNVVFGWKYFKEKDILKKLSGSVIMVIGAVILILN